MKRKPINNNCYSIIMHTIVKEREKFFIKIKFETYNNIHT